MNITLTTEQEIFIKQQLETGKYTSADEIINKAFSLLAKEETPQKYVIQGGELAQKKLQEKIAMFKKVKEENKNKPVDPERQKLAEEFRKLCAETQALNADNPLTDEEIQAEIDAYRRGE
jgi:Arc/MetJ-type ribon-helix-helix transcriptional regulator